MKYLCLGFLFLGVSMASASQISLDDGNVTFNAPDGFTPLTPEEIEAKFPLHGGTVAAVGNEKREVIISYSIMKILVRPDQLSETKDDVTASFMKTMPDGKLVKSDFMQINGTRWIYQETITPGADGDFHNIEITTSYRNVMLSVSFNSTVDLFESYHEKLQACLNSIKISATAAALPPLSSPMQVALAAEDVKLGQKAFKDGRLDEAMSDYKTALSLDNQQARACIGLGLVESEREHTKEALNYFAEAILDDMNDSDTTEAYYCRAGVELKDGDLDSAWADIDKVIQLAPGSPGGYCTRADIEVRRGDINAAATDFNHALIVHPQWIPALQGRAHINLMRGKLDDAMQDLQVAANLHHDNPGVIYEMVCVDLIRGKPDSALQNLRTSIDSAASHRWVQSPRLLLWAVEAQQGHEDDATRELSVFLQDDKSIKDDWAKNIGTYLTGQMTENDLIESAHADNPFKDKLLHCRVWYFMGVKRLVDGDKPGADECFRKCLETNLPYADYYLLASAQLGEGPAAVSGDGQGFYPVILALIGGAMSLGIAGIILFIAIFSSRPERIVPSHSPQIIRAPPLK